MKYRVITAINRSEAADMARAHYGHVINFLVFDKPPHVSHIAAQCAESLADKLQLEQARLPEHRQGYHLMANLTDTNDWVILWP